MKGKVYLAGAGPGDMGLLTLRAKELLETADVIVYDRLINDRILDLAKPGCEKIDAGKESGHHKIKQDKIEEVLAKKALSGKIVLRLKGGDPYLFGRGSEEALYLKDKKIDFEVVPGVTSAIAGPSYAGIPVTHRELALSATFITGHRAEHYFPRDAACKGAACKGKNPLGLDWENLAKNNGTLVFLMGMSNLHLICENLIKNGKDKNTPAAVVSNATFPLQKKAVGTLSNIAEKAKKAKISSPGIIIIGKVVLFSDKLDWFSKKYFPLKDKNILIPRSRERQLTLRNILEELGARTISFPVIKHIEINDKNAAKILNNISRYDYIVFTSPTTIEFLVKELKKLNLDIRALYGPKICVIGPGTLKSLEEFNIKTDIIPKKFIAEGLIETLRKKNIEGKKILIIRSENARETLPVELKKSGAEVDVLNIYKTVIDRPSNLVVKDTADLIKNNKLDLVVFMSGTQVKNFSLILKNHADIKNIKCACIGPETEKEAKAAGFNTVIKSKEYSLAGLIKAIEQHYKKRK